MSKSPRQFDFQQKNSLKTNVELKGTLIKKNVEAESHEYNPFRKLNVHELPDSKRTMVPGLAVIKINFYFSLKLKLFKEIILLKVFQIIMELSHL